MKENWIGDSPFHECERNYLYIGDEFGYVKLWNLEKLIDVYQVNPVPKITEIRTYFNPNRKEHIDNSNYARQLRTSLNKAS